MPRSVHPVQPQAYRPCLSPLSLSRTQGRYHGRGRFLPIGGFVGELVVFVIATGSLIHARTTRRRDHRVSEIAGEPPKWRSRSRDMAAELGTPDQRKPRKRVRATTGSAGTARAPARVSVK